jgi:phosphotransferase system  glucose/maltose/N-acetylglucosamine-specific IIC component
MIFRNRPFWVFAWALLALIALVFGLGASSIGGGGTFGAAAIIAVFAYVIWVIGCHSAVRMDSSGMIVDDILTRHVIPWSELRAIDVRGGLVFEVRGGPYIQMMMYGGSLIGVVTGYRRQRKTTARMDAARERFQGSAAVPEPPAHYSRTIALSPWPPLVILAAMEAIAAVGVLAR